MQFRLPEYARFRFNHLSRDELVTLIRDDPDLGETGFLSFTRLAVRNETIGEFLPDDVAPASVPGKDARVGTAKTKHRRTVPGRASSRYAQDPEVPPRQQDGYDPAFERKTERKQFLKLAFLGSLHFSGLVMIFILRYRSRKAAVSVRLPTREIGRP